LAGICGTVSAALLTLTSKQPRKISTNAMQI